MDGVAGLGLPLISRFTLLNPKGITVIGVPAPIAGLPVRGTKLKPVTFVSKGLALTVFVMFEFPDELPAPNTRLLTP
jgi:hypothetical protein